MPGLGAGRSTRDSNTQSNSESSSRQSQGPTEGPQTSQRAAQRQRSSSEPLPRSPKIKTATTENARRFPTQRNPFVRTASEQTTQTEDEAIQPKSNFEKFNLEEFLGNYFDNRINTRIPYTRQQQMPFAQPIMPFAQPMMPFAQPMMPEHGRALMLLQEITRLDRQALKQPLNDKELDYYNKRVQELFKLTGIHFPSVEQLYNTASKDIRKNPYLNPWHKDYNPNNLKPTPEEKRIIYERLKKQLLPVTEKFYKNKKLLDNTGSTASFLFNNVNITKNNARDRDKTKKRKRRYKSEEKAKRRTSGRTTPH